MKMFLFNRTALRPILFATALLLAASSAYAATVTAVANPEYRRLNFAFPAPANMKMKREGTKLSLSFNKPLGVKAADIKSQLGSYATAVNTSSDGKTLVITLKNPSRVRQFSNGKLVGIDIVGPPPTDATPESTTPPANPPPADDQAATSIPQAPAASAAIPFKQAEKPQPVRGPVSKSVPIPAVEQKETLSPEAAALGKAALAALKAERRPSGNKEFLVTAQKTNDGTILNFPWPSRVAAAVFERPRAIWIIFSHEANVRAETLSTIMPKQVIRVQQYDYPGAMILRLTTDGTIHPITSQSGSNYEWNVLLGNTTEKPTLDTPINTDTKGDQNDLLLDVYDISGSIQFYDPVINDQLIAIPTFEAGRGVLLPREYPEFALLGTQQGIVISSLRDDITPQATRKGMKITAATPLAISSHLPLVTQNAPPIPGASAAANVMMPYDQWYVAPKDFKNERIRRLKDIASATNDSAPDAMLSMISLYLAQGFTHEAGAYLSLIKQSYPEYYAAKKLALLQAVCATMMGHFPEAAEAVAAKELDGFEEATLWREFIAAITPAIISTENAKSNNEPQPAAADASSAPAPAATPPPPTITAPAPEFDWLGYNKSFIHFYPPRIRQRMAVLMADIYSAQGREEDALKMYDTLGVDGILDPIRADAEVMIGTIALKKKRTDEALSIFERLSTDKNNRHAQTAAKFGFAMTEYTLGKADAATTANKLEGLRLGWHGDRLAHSILLKLSQVYKDNKEYASALRTLKYLLDEFPDDPQFTQISTEMSDFFDELFLHGQADSIEPLKSLALFYEFRDLTPVGEKGDAMIQNLANRLASVDLLDRATQLLENQIKYRVGGESRARLGAELALLYLFNQQPNEALNAIQTTNFVNAPESLRLQRGQLTAKALASLGKPEEALGILTRDKSADASLLRLEILWGTKDWPNVINQAEDILAARPNLTAPLDTRETETLLKLVLGYNFEGDRTQLKYLRDYYGNLLPNTSYKQIFDFLTNDTNPLDTNDFALVAEQISRTESFMNRFKEKIAQGKLSESIQ